ncbi:lipopolysaccharide biosynthesis protein [Amycolatopsis sp. NPDC059021]|uniref:lipopolysaccharide biosynthesis protein n=1 Tax=Amycolatopsis sp. NPDC059021 TaxID=3346704 RepID=UPI003671CA5E
MSTVTDNTDSTDNKAGVDGRTLAKDTGKSAGKVGLSLLIAIGLGYVLTLVIGRLLSPADYGVFSSFWGLLMGLGSALSPLEQEISRQSAVAALDGKKAGKSSIRAMTIGMVIVTAIALLTLVPMIGDRVYSGHTELAIIVLCGAISFACQFSARGLLMGHDRIRSYSWLVIAEAVVRIAGLGAVVIAGITGLVPLAIAAALGSFAWLVFARPVTQLVDPHLDGEAWRPLIGRIVLLLIGSGLAAAVIGGYPTLIKLLAPTPDETKFGVLAAALMVARVPLLLLSPLQALAVPTAVRLSSTAEGMHRLRRMLAVGTLGTLVLAAVGALVGFLIGPWLIKLLFGANFVAEAWWMTGLVWGTVLLTAMQLMAAVLVARTQANKVLLTWASVTLTTALILLFFPGDAILRAVVGLGAGPTVGLAVVLVFVLRRPGNANAAEASR